MGNISTDEQFEIAFDTYAKAIEKYCRVRLGEAAESTDDCVQEAFLVYYKRLLNGEEFENPRAFLYKTANNMVLKAREEYFKNAKRHEELSKAENIAIENEDVVIENIDFDEVKQILLSQLSDGEQQLYDLKYSKQKTLKEIGELLDIPPAAVANRTSRLRAKIKRLVEPVLTEFRKGGS